MRTRSKTVGLVISCIERRKHVVGGDVAAQASVQDAPEADKTQEPACAMPQHHARSTNMRASIREDGTLKLGCLAAPIPMLRSACMSAFRTTPTENARVSLATLHFGGRNKEEGKTANNQHYTSEVDANDADCASASPRCNDVSRPARSGSADGSRRDDVGRFASSPAASVG